jgi:Leucine-rich repeat (LRR) protein
LDPLYNNKQQQQTITGNNNLNGTFPEEICLLTELEELVMTNSDLAGELPRCIRDMSSLVTLNLNSNNLSGNLPSGLLLAPSLEVLNLSSNLFMGKLDVMLEGAQFTLNPTAEKLKRLYLQHNAFSGVVPPVLSYLSNLEELTLHGNSLTGVIDFRGSDSTCVLEVLTADCKETTCSCCTQCY